MELRMEKGMRGVRDTHTHTHRLRDVWGVTRYREGAQGAGGGRGCRKWAV